MHGDDAGGGDGAEAGDQGGERDCDASDGAVGVADEEAVLEVVGFALVWDEGEVVYVDGRDDEWRVGCKPVVFRIGEDGEVGVEEVHFCCCCSPTGQCLSASLEFHGKSCKEADQCEDGSLWLFLLTYLAGDIAVKAGKDDVAVLELIGFT